MYTLQQEQYLEIERDLANINNINNKIRIRFSLTGVGVVKSG